jgi:hypothetical protein
LDIFPPCILKFRLKYHDFILPLATITVQCGDCQERIRHIVNNCPRGCTLWMYCGGGVGARLCMAWNELSLSRALVSAIFSQITVQGIDSVWKLIFEMPVFAPGLCSPHQYRIQFFIKFSTPKKTQTHFNPERWTAQLHKFV